MASKQRLGPASAIHDSRLGWGREREREREHEQQERQHTDEEEAAPSPRIQTLTPRYVLLLYHTTQRN